jgi:putative ABC transport system permease protein
VIASLLVEGLVLALVGGAVGFLASLWGVDLLMQLAPSRLPRAADIHVDQRAFVFALLTSAGAGLLVALAPALQSVRADVIERLKASGRTLHAGGRARLRNALVVVQVAVAVVLLTAAALLVRSLWNVQTIDTGIQLHTLLTSRVWLPQPNDPQSGPYFAHDKRVVLMRAILDRLSKAPEIEAAGITTALPATTDSGSTPFAVEGWTPDRRDLATTTSILVTPGYFPALGMRLVEGRLLQDSDDVNAPRAVVVNETFSRTYFSGESPVGRRFHIVGRRGQVPANAPWITIVGVVRDVREDAVDAPIRPEVYQSLWQVSTLGLAVVARGRTGPPGLATVKAAVQSGDPNLPVYAVRTGEELVSAQLAPRLFATRLINAFACAALFLAAFGLHGVIAYGVRQRTHEIGIRVALGATALRIIGLVLGQAAHLTALGVAIGIAGSFVASQLMTSMLYGARIGDPAMLTAVVLLLTLVVGVATFGAARRASKIEAAVALRE